MLETLRQELENDPLGRGYATMDDAQVLASLREKNRPKLKALSSAELLAWSGSNNRKRKIFAGITSGPNDDIKNICDVATELLRRDNTELDLNRADRVQMAQGLVAGGILTEADYTALVTMATYNVSRLEELGMQDFHEGDIQCARKTGPWADPEPAPAPEE